MNTYMPKCVRTVRGQGAREVREGSVCRKYCVGVWVWATVTMTMTVTMTVTVSMAVYVSMAPYLALCDELRNLWEASEEPLTDLGCIAHTDLCESSE